jgi:GWxTD domain-containing protein
MKRILLLASLLVGSCIPGAAQPDDLPPSARTRPEEFISAAAFPLSGTQDQRVDVHVRFPLGSLVPVRDANGPSGFVRRGELTVECADSAGAVLGRMIEQIELPASGSEDPPLPMQWIERSVSMTIPSGNYSVNAELVDLQSRNRLVSRVPFPPPAVRGGVAARVVFVYSASAPGIRPDTLFPANFGNGFHFSLPGGVVIALPGIPDSVGRADAHYSFREAKEGKEKGPAIEEKDVQGIPLCGSPDTVGGRLVGYRFAPGPGPVRYLALPLPLERLPLRRFLLEVDVTAGGASLSCNAPLAVVWPEQPESLRDVTYALESLRFFVSEHELDSLSSGDFSERVTHLEQFWKKRDPTPETADNPIMTEFYRRVDHARTAFATLKVKDGTRSDRGKIYVLHGPPTHVERTLDPSRGFTEVWSYERPRKEFTFRDPLRDGSYILSPSTAP